MRLAGPGDFFFEFSNYEFGVLHIEGCSDDPFHTSFCLRRQMHTCRVGRLLTCVGSAVLSVSFLILVICHLSLSSLSLVEVCQCTDLCKEPAVSSFISVFLFSVSLISALIFIVPPLLCFGFLLFLFCRVLMVGAWATDLDELIFILSELMWQTLYVPPRALYIRSNCCGSLQSNHLWTISMGAV